MKLPDAAALRFADHLRDLTTGVDVILSDVWGVIHDGLTGFVPACEALQTFRKRGGTVIMITNAPRPADSVQRQLRRMNISDDTYDAIVSSGDLTRNFVASHHQQAVFQIGPERDNPVFRGLDVKFTTIENADYVTCTGLFDDETETAEDYRGVLEKARTRDLTFVCANPDIVVERGDRLIYCAGAIAEAYEKLGGEVQYAGKPHAPIYTSALAIAGRLTGGDVAQSRVLAIGDGVATDIRGASAAGIRSVFVASGVHVARGVSVTDAADALFASESMKPIGLMTALVW